MKDFYFEDAIDFFIAEKEKFVLQRRPNERLALFCFLNFLYQCFSVLSLYNTEVKFKFVARIIRLKETCMAPINYNNGSPSNFTERLFLEMIITESKYYYLYP